jgi:methylated-DNA-[protein]-cysteine S-methyltransferase
MDYYMHDTPVGKITLVEENHRLIGLYFGEHHPDEATEREGAVIAETRRQLDAYFAVKRKCFTVPLAPTGTAFRRKIWELLLDIPYGETITYGELAHRAGNPHASRAVGGANHNNPLAILIPCHRVIGAGGKLVGYGGGLLIKEFLLKLEKGYA